ncbi:MAG: lysylphosphatidylglycerol synthase domain-containing protein [Acidimicrobiia bacterium]
MSWVRTVSEPPVRRTVDITKFATAVVALVVAGIYAQAQTQVDVSFYAPLNQLTDSLDGLFRFWYVLGSPWAILVVVLGLLALRQWDVALRAGAASGIAWGAAALLLAILDAHSVSGVDVRWGDGPAFPAMNVAIATALLFAISAYLVRPLRRLLALVVVLVAVASMYLGVALPSDVLGGLLLGFATASLVAMVLGTISGKPSADEVHEALVDLGYTPTDLSPSRMSVGEAAVFDVVMESGDTARVDAYGRDQRETQVAARIWHRAMYKEPGTTVFGSRVQHLEHVAYATLLASRAGVRVPELVMTGVGGPDAALLVTRPPEGSALSDLEPDQITDAMLRDAWSSLVKLHEAGVTHGNLGLNRVVTTVDGIALDDFADAGVNGDEFWANRDRVALLVDTALHVGHERAIAAAVDVLDKEDAGALIPFVQPAALPAAVGTDIKHLSKDLKALRAFLAEATGADDAPPLQIKRLTAANIGILVGVLFALCIATASLDGINWSEVQKEFETATWGWAVFALVLYPLVPMSWATALLGCVNMDLRFVPTVLVQLACSFLNLITPNGIGGTALQLDYLHKQGVPLASGGSAMVLSTGVGGAIQMVLFLVAATITATSLNNYDTGGGSASLWIIALVAAAIGIILLIPKIRGKVVPAVTRAASDIWSVLRNPRKALQLFGGDLAGNLIYPALLGLCLLCFHSSLGFAQLVVVQIGAGMLGNVAPVPGGIGVTEAALTAGLTGFGIDANTALATVIVFRGITFALPPVFGFFTLRWLRKVGYA